MKTSSSGRALIEQREGRRLSAYRDSRGIWTIGVGHTGRMSPPAVTPSMTITETESDAYLAADLAPVEQVINAAVKVPISQKEFDAMVSLGFNIGAAGLRGSSVISKLNLGDIEGAAAAFMLWDRPAALEGRRVAERAQFLTPDASGKAVAEARAQTLAAHADVAKAKAGTTQTAGSAMAFGGVAAAATLHAAHPTFALVVFGLVLAGAAVDGGMVWRHRRSATTLAANATRQSASVAMASDPAPLTVVESSARPTALPH